MSAVIFDSINKAIIGTFKGFLEMSQHQEIGNEVLKEVGKNLCPRLIIDTSELSVMRKETQKWIEEDWFPRAIKINIKFMAFVVSKDAFGKMSTKSVNQKAGPIEIQYFDSLGSAKTWISSKK
jgi:hypothetical protein